MAQKIIELNCPGCGARVDTGQKNCEWCHKPIIISSFSSVYSMPMPEINKYTNNYKKALESNPDNVSLNKSVAMCYLKLKMYSKALQSFEKAIEEDFNDSELYFYTSLAILDGKKAFLAPRAKIDKALEYSDAAIRIEPKGIYYFFQAYLKYDYFHRKCFRVSPDYKELLEQAKSVGVSDNDVKLLFEILNVNKPEVF